MNILFLSSKENASLKALLSDFSTGGSPTHVRKTEEAVALLQTQPFDVFVAKLGDKRSCLAWDAMKCAPATTFKCIHSWTATNDPVARLNLFAAAKVNMVTAFNDDLCHVLQMLLVERQCIDGGHGNLSCPMCGKGGFDEQTLVTHAPLFHVYSVESAQPGVCPVCSSSCRAIGRHLKHKHDQMQDDDIHDVSPPLYSYALAVVQHPSEKTKFLLVQEFAGQGYWLPGGRVEAWETLQQGAVREALEEVGVAIKLTGVLTVSYSPARGLNPAVVPNKAARSRSRLPTYVRCSAVFLATPQNPADCNPKTIPDFESAGACWVDVRQLEKVKLRGHEPLKWIEHVVNGGYIAPLEIFGSQ